MAENVSSSVDAAWRAGITTTTFGPTSGIPRLGRQRLPTKREQVEAVVDVVLAKLEVVRCDRLAAAIVRRSVVPEHGVVERLTQPARHQSAQPEGVHAQQAVELGPLLPEQLHVE